MDFEASHLIQEAVLAKDANRLTEARDLFEQAAALEEETAREAARSGHAQRQVISLLSALTCWLEAGRIDNCLVVGRQLLNETLDVSTPTLREVANLLLEAAELALETPFAHVVRVSVADWKQARQFDLSSPSVDDLPIFPQSSFAFGVLGGGALRDAGTKGRSR